MKNLWGPHLYLPGNSATFIHHLPLIDIRCVVLDLEDAIPMSQKIQGLQLVKHAISYLRELAPHFIIIVRINRPDIFPELCTQEISTLVSSKPDAICIPFVSSEKEVLFVDELITEAEEKYSIPSGSIALQPMIESSRALINIDQIAGASARNEALALGGADWRDTHGLNRLKSCRELDYVRTCMVTVAAEFELFALDTVFPWFEDAEAYEMDCENSRNIGISGKAIATPAQIEITNRYLKPDDERLAWAKNLLSNLKTEVYFNEARQFYKDRFIDPKIIFQAKKILTYLD